MRQELDCAVSILTDGATTDELVVRPVTDSPKRHFDKLRSVLAKRGTGPATINHTFSGIRGTVHAAWETWAGRRQDADRCHGRTERKSTTAPAASTMRRHRRSATLVRQTLPGPALHKRYPIKHAVPYDGVVDSVRGIQRGDLLQRLQFGAPEVHHHERQGYHSLGNRSQQRFLKPVRLALYNCRSARTTLPRRRRGVSRTRAVAALRVRVDRWAGTACPLPHRQAAGGDTAGSRMVADGRAQFPYRKHFLCPPCLPAGL